MNKKIEQLEAKLEKVRREKEKAQRQKEAADEKIKNYINLFVALSEESGLSYQEMKELILPALSSNQGENHV